MKTWLSPFAFIPMGVQTLTFFCQQSVKSFWLSLFGCFPGCHLSMQPADEGVPSLLIFQAKSSHFPSSHSLGLCFNPVNLPDLIQKCFGYSSCGQYSQHAARIRPDHIIMPDPTCCIWFSSISSSKESLGNVVQNWPRSDLDGVVRFWSNAPVPEANWCARIIRCQQTMCWHSFVADSGEMTGTQQKLETKFRTEDVHCYGGLRGLCSRRSSERQ